MTSSSPLAFDLSAAPISVAHVTLLVRDLDRMTRFYRDLLGLTVLSQTATQTSLGLDTAFLTLSAPGGLDANSGQFAGLYHTAFLLPARADLGAWLDHVQAKGIRLQGAADHGVSEAIYLADPEGNGIEVYADRPTDQWYDDQGNLQLTTEPLSAHTLPQGRWSAAPPGTRIGHVHLQTTDLAAAETFWSDAGFTAMARAPGGIFWGAGGYHHQLATNVWSRGRKTARHDGIAGLSDITLYAPDVAATQAQTRTAPSGVRVTFTTEKV
ncbi:Catechol-2,3-dioxygenase [Tritonibacter multivorans]|uniref:Catechol-2,3-dioxygenase n=1 Tax=Tritonibacter multivorans TaxID=928856 RepID=A0A0P1GB96_9RHOB|nr:VOC family protein [Tritonibacter multivorans]MDA7422015.1 VOC family protein [Tritonibacter multivorans]CUH78656.1 Catechol-2,3-dioxygenase [Tritonibacter multivorans]SFD66540.1 catechol 2,3-dioxygenase [Tritonibacter multivorans]